MASGPLQTHRNNQEKDLQDTITFNFSLYSEKIMKANYLGHSMVPDLLCLEGRPSSPERSRSSALDSLLIQYEAAQS